MSLSRRRMSWSPVRDFNPVVHEYEAGVLITRPGVAPVRKWYTVQFRSRETVALVAQQMAILGWQAFVTGPAWGCELVVWRNECSTLLIAYIKHRNVSSLRVVFSHGSVSRPPSKKW